MAPRKNSERLASFIARMTKIINNAGDDEEKILAQGTEALRRLVSVDDWLPDYCAIAHPQFCSQYLLYCDPLERFSLVSFVWGPGQQTPIHDHTVWGLVGMLRGAEISQRFERGTPMQLMETERLEAGMVDVISPRIGDIHRVMNAFFDRSSISIHVYGGNIGAVERHVFDAATGTKKMFISGYFNDRLPNPWRGAVRLS